MAKKKKERYLKSYKMFDGQRFTRMTTFHHKKFADNTARKYREGGYKARVVKSSNGYSVYIKRGRR